MKPQALWLLLIALGLALDVAMPTQGLVAGSSDVAVATMRRELYGETAMAEGDSGSDDSGSDDEGSDDDSD